MVCAVLVFLEHTLTCLFYHFLSFSVGSASTGSSCRCWFSKRGWNLCCSRISIIISLCSILMVQKKVIEQIFSKSNSATLDLPHVHITIAAMSLDVAEVNSLTVLWREQPSGRSADPAWAYITLDHLHVCFLLTQELSQQPYTTLIWIILLFLSWIWSVFCV